MAAREPVLNRRLTLEARVRAPDGAGGYSESWVALGDHWADVKSARGREAERDGIAASTVPWKIYVRAAPAGRPSRPTPDQRFREGLRCFRILAVSEFDRMGRFLVCDALEEEASA